ncbi:VOC family protein [Rhodobacteraceae bacterium CCMM004]|nr:VOC family protein [Rhodobacteraceae bacterium CCMM004]
MPATLEHVNVTVPDPDATAARLCDLFGWHVRWRGASIHGGTSVHVGTDDSYVAVYSGPGPQTPPDDTYRQIGGLNHIGVVVDDLSAAEARVEEAGLTPHSHADYEPGRRFYFRDGDGVEYEVVSYA